MYAGTTFNRNSGRIGGAHQRIDRIARRSLTPYVGRVHSSFPHIAEILHFEGNNGPDGIKRKSPGRDEPWHFIDPNNSADTALIEMCEDHIYNLAEALNAKNSVRAAFEAAWLAHAITDGMTPAHHYPLEEKLEELRGGEGLETRSSTKDKLVIPGKTRRHQIRNNWEFWGAKGVMTTHLNFELGVASVLAGRPPQTVELPKELIAELHETSFAAVYRRLLLQVADLHMYETFTQQGWTRQMAHQTQDILIPTIVWSIMLGWYAAIEQAGEIS